MTKNSIHFKLSAMIALIILLSSVAVAQCPGGGYSLGGALTVSGPLTVYGNIASSGIITSANVAATPPKQGLGPCSYTPFAQPLYVASWSGSCPSGTLTAATCSGAGYSGYPYSMFSAFYPYNMGGCQITAMSASGATCTCPFGIYGYGWYGGSHQLWLTCC